MSDYHELVKKEAKAFFGSQQAAFLEDAGEFGGKSANPNMARWIDRTQKLSERVAEITAKWGPLEFRWVQANTRNKIPHGDPRDNSFASFIQDIHREIKKLAKS